MTLYACPKCGKWSAHRGTCDSCLKARNPHCNRTPCFTCGRYNTPESAQPKVRPIVSLGQAVREFIDARGIGNELQAKDNMIAALEAWEAEEGNNA